MIDTPVTRYQPWQCGRCGHWMDAASHVTEKIVPKEGDISVCVACAEPYKLYGDCWVPLSDDELISLTLEEKRDLSRLQLALRKWHRRRKGGPT